MLSTEIVLADRTKASVTVDGSAIIVRRQGHPVRRLTTSRDVLDYVGPLTLRRAVVRTWEAMRAGLSEVPPPPVLPEPRSPTQTDRELLTSVSMSGRAVGWQRRQVERLERDGYIVRVGDRWALTESGRMALYGRTA